MEAAERAAAAGDHATAETLLREAAHLQESSLGPLHPDLANTLNNLGVVFEITGKPDDAERCYRRAWAIAAAALPANHPFVATSRKNLEDLCAARGKPVDAQPDVPRPVGGRTWPRSLETGALVAAGLLVTVVVIATWYRTSEEGEPRPESPVVSRQGRVADEQPTPRRSTPTPPAGGAVAQRPTVPPPRERPTPRASRARAPEVVDARLCRELTTAGQREWSCVPPGDPVSPGPLAFYTRIRSPIDVTVEHRWFYGGYLNQVVELRVRANTGPGYRTYSRNTIGRERPGNWRIELRNEDGALLHEERFVVR